MAGSSTATAGTIAALSSSIAPSTACSAALSHGDACWSSLTLLGFGRGMGDASVGRDRLAVRAPFSCVGESGGSPDPGYLRTFRSQTRRATGLRYAPRLRRLHNLTRRGSPSKLEPRGARRLGTPTQQLPP